MEKPMLKITTHPTTKHKYLSVIIKDPYHTLGSSFGRADKLENWERCIDFLLEELRKYYMQKAENYVPSPGHLKQAGEK